MKRKENIYEVPLMEVLIFKVSDIVTLSSDTYQDADAEKENFEEIFGQGGGF